MPKPVSEFPSYSGIVWLPHSWLIHSSVSEHLGCSRVLTLVNHAAVNIGGQVSVPVPAIQAAEFIPRSRNAGLYANSMFNFSRGRHAVLQ